MSAALSAHRLQVKHENQETVDKAAARHFRGWILRAAMLGWRAYIAELYRGIDAANMSARYRALDALNRCM